LHASIKVKKVTTISVNKILLSEVNSKRGYINTILPIDTSIISNKNKKHDNRFFLISLDFLLYIIEPLLLDNILCNFLITSLSVKYSAISIGFLPIKSLAFGFAPL
jgi:hypothetical protein